jgi:hypothetical protein
MEKHSRAGSKYRTLLHRNCENREKLTGTHLSVSSSSNTVGEIGSGYPTNVYDGNRLSLPKLGQKMVQSCGRMFIDLPDGCCYGQNT